MSGFFVIENLELSFIFCIFVIAFYINIYLIFIQKGHSLI